MATCSGCSSVWGGSRLCHCSGCHLTFGGIVGFDAHRYRGRCLDPAERGMVARQGIWVRPTSRVWVKASGAGRRPISATARAGSLQGAVR